MATNCRVPGIYALLVGIDRYPPPIHPLRGCVNDVLAFETYLQTRVDRDGYHLHLRVLKDEQATRQAIIDGFRDHLAQATEQDIVLFYYCGHGSQEDTPPEFWSVEPDRLDETLVCWDSRLEGRWDLADKELAKLIAEVAVQRPHIAIILDCCHAGSGTRDASPDSFTRRTPPDSRPRPLSSFITSPEEVRRQPTTRSLESSGTGWNLAIGRHLLLAACRDYEEAKEIQAEGQHWGAFSYFLLETLQTINGNLTYRDLFKRAHALIRSRVIAQSPQLEATHSEDVDQAFLGGAIAQRVTYFTVSHQQDQGWIMDGGAMHGIQPPSEETTTQLALFPFASQPVQMQRISEAIATAAVTERLPGFSKLTILQGAEQLTPDLIFKAVVTSIPLPPLTIALEGDEAGVALVRQALRGNLPGANSEPSAYVCEVEPSEGATWQVSAQEGNYRIVHAQTNRALGSPLQSYNQNNAAQLVRYLEHIARWTIVAELASPANSRIPPTALQMHIYPGESSQTGEILDPAIHLTYSFDPQQQRWHPPAFRVKLRNTSPHETLFCALLDLTESFGITALLPGGTVRLEPGEELWLQGGKPLYGVVPKSLWQQGITDRQDIFKLIACTTDFDATLLEQGELGEPVTRSHSHPTRGAGTLNRLMRQVNTREIRLQPEEEEIYDDWIASQVTFTFVRPQTTTTLQPDSSSDLGAGVILHAHARLQGQARLVSLPRAARNLGNCILPPLLREHDQASQPWQFTTSRSSDPGLSGLELTQVPDCTVVTLDQPLRLSCDAPLQPGEHLLPIGYDGEFFIPLGWSQSQAGKTEIILERLPEPVQDGRRSLTGAIYILFQKLVSQKLGLAFPYPVLAAVDSHANGAVSSKVQRLDPQFLQEAGDLKFLQSIENESLDYQVQPEQIAARVASAQRILLCIHGLAGDSRTIATSLWTPIVLGGQSQPLAHLYDLVLTLDYESINTSLEENARLLQQRLEAVGLGVNHGKVFHILAYSIGGLIARWFVEQEQGHRVVSHLILVGTPNAGSPWPTLKTWATTTLAIALNNFFTIAMPVTVLANLLTAIESLDVTLDQLQPDSQFLRSLAASPDPGIPYTVIAGNASILPAALTGGYLARLLQKLLLPALRHLVELPFLGQPNDLVAATHSLKSLPPGRAIPPQIREVACHHFSYWQSVGLQALAEAILHAQGSNLMLPSELRLTSGATSLIQDLTPAVGVSATSPQTKPVNPPVPLGFSQHVAIVIGINHYQSGIAPLQTAVNDAQHLAHLLQTAHGYDVALYLDQDATLERLQTLLQATLPQQVGPEDRLLIYFAGHGIALNQEDGPAGYLVPQDAQPGKSQTYLSMQTFHDALASLPCRHLLVILDCCFAGAFRWSSFRDILTMPEELHQERYDRFIQDPAWQVITSAGFDQKALDVLALQDDRGSIGNHSPFAQALFQAIQGEADLYPPAQNGNPAGDGVITATELYLYLRHQVELKSRSTSPRQTPGLWQLKKHDKGEYIFLVPGKDVQLPPAPPLNVANNPYQGLASFGADQSALFFGRDRLVNALLERVTTGDSPLTIVLGASGSGKSSLVNAGLIPRLLGLTNLRLPIPDSTQTPAEQTLASAALSQTSLDGAIDTRFLSSPQTHWHVIGPIRPGESPLNALLQASFSLPGDHGGAEQIAFWQATIRQQPQAWVNWLTTWNQSQSQPNHRVLLVIDQFEELVTLCSHDREREDFLTLLSAALTSHASLLRVVITLRSDFEPQFSNSRLKPHWMAARFTESLLMTQDELRQVIEQPAYQRVLYFQPADLVDRLINEVVQMPGALPLLSFTLSELYRQYGERQGNDRCLTQADYEALGGVANSLAQRASAEYESLVVIDTAYAQTVRRVMLRMVSLTGQDLSRRRVLLSELDYADASENQRVAQVVQRLTAARLTIVGQDSSGNAYIEPAHDVLVHGWFQLREWARTELMTLRLQRQLHQAAILWLQRGKKSDFCLRGTALKEATRFYRQAPGEWNRLEQQFLQASQRYHRNRWGSGITAVLVGLALVGGFASWLQQEAWLDRQLRLAVFNLPNPQTVPTLLNRLPDRLHQADRNRQQGKADQAIQDYRTILAALKRLQRGITEDPPQYQFLSAAHRQTLNTLTLAAENGLAQTIREYRLPQLQTELQSGNFGDVVSLEFSQFEHQFSGALKQTYAILFREAGAKADQNDDGYLNDYEEDLLPCQTLQEIDRLWRRHTNDRCGWYGAKDIYEAPACTELRGNTLTTELFIQSSVYLIERRLQQCSTIAPK